MSRKTKLSLMCFLAGTIVSFVMMLLIIFESMDGFEARTRSLRFLLRGNEPISSDIVLVEIDDKTIDNLDWPINRGLYAQFIKIMHDNGAKTIGFDILFRDPYQKKPEMDDLFGHLLNIHGNSILGTEMVSFEIAPKSKKLYKNLTEQDILKFGLNLNINNIPKADKINMPILPILNGAKNIGFVNLIADSLGTICKMHPFYNYKSKIYPSLVLSMFMFHNGLNEKNIYFEDNSINIRGNNINTEIPLDKDGGMWVNFKGTLQNIKSYSFIDILISDEAKKKGEKGTILLSDFKDKAVIVGQTASSLGDHAAIPFENNTPLVTVHVNALDNLLKNELMNSAPVWINGLITLLLGIIISLIAGFLNIKRATILSAAIFAGFLLVNQFAFNNSYLLAVFIPGATIIINFILVMTLNYFVRDTDVRILKDAFSSFVSPGIMKKIMDNPEQIDLGGRKKELTLLFSDIKGYTSLSNTLNPNEILELLRDYLDEMTRLILKYDGTIDKIMGDGIMAFFGDPIEYKDHAMRAVSTAVDMHNEVKKLVKRWESEGKSGMQIRIGIATGEVFVGNIGSRQHLEYTALGPTVNLASRLETKAYPGGVLICEETYNYVKDNFVCIKSEGLDLKGYKDLYYGYHVIGKQGEVSDINEVKETLKQNNASTIKNIDWNGPEKRRAKRWIIDKKIEYECNGNLYSAIAVDISESGINLEHVDERCSGLKKGDEVKLLINIPTDIGEIPFKLLGSTARFVKGENIVNNLDSKNISKLEKLSEHRGFCIKFWSIRANSSDAISYFVKKAFGENNNVMQNIEQTNDDDNLHLRYDINKFMEKIIINEEESDLIDLPTLISKDVENLKTLFLFGNKNPKVYRRHLLMERLVYELERAKKYKKVVSIIKYQLDFNKEKFNQTESKDRKIAFKKIMVLIYNNLSSIDHIYEINSQTVLIMFPETDKMDINVIKDNIYKDFTKWLKAYDFTDSDIKTCVKSLTFSNEANCNFEDVFKWVREGNT